MSAVGSRWEVIVETKGADGDGRRLRHPVRRELQHGVSSTGSLY